MVVLIDNYDSFSYNLYQLLGGLLHHEDGIRVIRNDEYAVDEVMAMDPSHIVISPGPGRPKDAGMCEDLIKKANGKIPLLGVCLGHQAICEALGGVVGYAKELMHGKQSQMKVINQSPLFYGLGKELSIARYHSLAVEEDTLPEELLVTGKTEDGEVMAVMTENGLTHGLQFHPESIMTPDGKRIMENFLSIKMK